MKGVDIINKALAEIPGEFLFEFEKDNRRFGVVSSMVKTKREIEFGEEAIYQWREDVVIDKDTGETWVVPAERLVKYGRKV